MMNRISAVAVAALACTSGAHAEIAYATNISSLSPSRCTLVRFDLDNPQSSLETVAVLPVGLVKGLVMTGKDKGWFVSVGSHPNTTGGLWRYENGVSTRVSDFQIGSVGWAGLTLLPDRSGLLLAMNDISKGFAEPTLYSLGFDGTRTERAVIQDETGDLEEFNGLATDPTTGRILGMGARGSDAMGQLFEIDPWTGLITRVGFTNSQVFAVGGLEFTPDGRLISLQDLFTTRVEEIDPATGRATLIGSVGGLNIAGSIAFVVPAPGTFAAFVLSAGMAGRRRM